MPLLLAAALAASGSGFAAPQPKPEELRELRQRIEQLKRELDAAEGTRAQAVDRLRESETAISDANRRLHELAGERNRLRAELEQINAETRTLRADLAGRERELARLLQARYAEGERGFLRALASGDDPHEIARDLVYQTYISRAQAQLIQRVREELARLGAVDTGAREKSAALAAVETNSRAERDALRAQAATRRQVLAQVSGQIQKSRRDLATAQRNETRLARLVQEFAQAARPAPGRGARQGAPDDTPAGGAFGNQKGRLRLPVSGELAARFGSPRRPESPSPKGVFIRAREGEEVRAIAAGRVVFADWMRGYGNLLIVDHGEGYLSIYGNNESVLRQAGDEVHAGDAVATVGTSGGNETSGLYFELRHQGKAFDPLPWMQTK